MPRRISRRRRVEGWTLRRCILLFSPRNRNRHRSCRRDDANGLCDYNHRRRLRLHGPILDRCVRIAVVSSILCVAKGAMGPPGSTQFDADRCRTSYMNTCGVAVMRKRNQGLPRRSPLPLPTITTTTFATATPAAGGCAGAPVPFPCSLISTACECLSLPSATTTVTVPSVSLSVATSIGVTDMPSITPVSTSVSVSVSVIATCSKFVEA
jgi:hypothetical protein